MRPVHCLQTAPDCPRGNRAAISRIQPDDSRARAVVRRLLDAVRQHEILAIDEHSHQQREEQRQHQRHFDDGGATLPARQGRTSQGEFADIPHKSGRACHAASIAMTNENGVENARRHFCVIYMISPHRGRAERTAWRLSLQSRYQRRRAPARKIRIIPQLPACPACEGRSPMRRAVREAGSPDHPSRG